MIAIETDLRVCFHEFGKFAIYCVLLHFQKPEMELYIQFVIFIPNDSYGRPPVYSTRGAKALANSKLEFCQTRQSFLKVDISSMLTC